MTMSVDRGAGDSESPPWEPHLEQAQALHRSLPVFVGYFDHCDEPFMPTGGQQADLEKLDAAGIRIFVCSIGFGCYFQTAADEYWLAGPDEWLLQKQLERIDYVLQNIDQCPRTRLVRTCEDLDACSSDSIGVILHLTGNNHILDLDTVDLLFAKGVRANHCALQYHNRWVGGYKHARVNGQTPVVLTDQGREIIARMNDRGIVIDMAHASDEAAQAMVEASCKPVIDGHTGSRTLVPSNPRCLSDVTLRAIADSGGVVGIHFADHMLCEKAWSYKYGAPGPHVPGLWAYNRHVLERTTDPSERMRLRRNREEQARFFAEYNLAFDPELAVCRSATVSDMADHIDYLINLIGVEHVALGGDVNGIATHQWPEDMDHIGELPHLTAELLRRGYDESRLAKFLFTNWIRVFRGCLPDQAGAASLRPQAACPA